VPCVVGDANSDILVDEVSLVENMERAPLHPLDQFRAFQANRPATPAPYGHHTGVPLGTAGWTRGWLW